jgi:hypothetical protein
MTRTVCCEVRTVDRVPTEWVRFKIRSTIVIKDYVLRTERKGQYRCVRCTIDLSEKFLRLPGSPM